MEVNTFVRGNGIARELNKKIVEHTISLDLNELYLLTEGVAGYFKKFGFKEINKNYVPTEILETLEFKQLCPSSAMCRYKKLKT